MLGFREGRLLSRRCACFVTKSAWVYVIPTVRPGARHHYFFQIPAPNMWPKVRCGFSANSVRLGFGGRSLATLRSPSLRGESPPTQLDTTHATPFRIPSLLPTSSLSSRASSDPGGDWQADDMPAGSESEHRVARSCRFRSSSTSRSRSVRGECAPTQLGPCTQFEFPAW